MGRQGQAMILSASMRCSFNVKAVLFDLDGVLVNTEEISTKASDKILKEVGIVQTRKERENVFGRRSVENYKAAIDARGLKLDPEVLVEKKIKVFKQMIKGNVEPLPGIRDLVTNLKTEAIKLAVVSSSPEERVYATLEEVKLKDEFDFIVTGDCCKLGKPDPEPFLMAARELGVAPADCVVIEDAQIGVQAALAAGMKCAAVKSPHTFGQDLEDADIVLEGTIQLSLEVLEGL